MAQDKIDVNGNGAHPLYKFLKERQPGKGFSGEKGRVEWNYVSHMAFQELS